jgi:hypothetical protein
MKRIAWSLIWVAGLGCRTDPLAKDTGLDTGSLETAVPVIDADDDGFPADEDCDDNNAEVHPEATEACNGLDDNCDGLVDDDDPNLDPSTQTAWYRDADSDGFGTESDRVDACEAPQWFVPEQAQGFDCNDTNAAYHPGADESDCTDPNDYNCDGSVAFADADQDGWPACLECNDADPAIHPDATEICDGLDNDCDGDTDDADASLDNSTATDWYADTDTDGFGDAAIALRLCEMPTGYIADNTDCDDAAITTYPGADEYCDGVDSDCDGTLDEDDALDAATWYADADMDTYGDIASTHAACTQPSGYVADNTDCDDSVNTTFPNADEYCDGVDSDCDGTLDEDDALDVLTWYADSDNDTYGDPSTSDIDCAQPSGYVSDNTDCNDTLNSIHPGATELCDGADQDCDGVADNGVLGSGSACAATDCAEILSDQPSASSGTYVLVPGNYTCDMSSNGGGWTLVGQNHPVWGTGFTTTSFNTEGFELDDLWFEYISGSTHGHCTYPGSLTGCVPWGIRFDGTGNWFGPQNWGSSVCNQITVSSAYANYTTFNGQDVLIAHSAQSGSTSTSSLQVGMLEGISSCTTSDNYGTAYMDIWVR